MYTMTEEMKNRFTHVANECKFNRAFARPLSRNQISSVFDAWKTAVETDLHNAVSVYAVSVRADGTAPAEEKTAVFDAWRAVLAMLTEKGAEGLKPAAEDIPALLTMAGRFQSVSTEEYKEAAKMKRDTKKNAAMYSDAEFIEWMKTTRGFSAEAIEEKKAEAEAMAERAADILKEAAAVEWNHYRDFVPTTAASFRKGVEDMIADRILSRRAKTAAEVKAERAARKEAKKEAAKKARAIAKAEAKEAAREEYEAKESEDRNREAREDAKAEARAETVLKGVRDSAARVSEAAADEAAATAAANDRADAREAYAEEE